MRSAIDGAIGKAYTKLCEIRDILNDRKYKIIINEICVWLQKADKTLYLDLSHRQ